MKKRTKLAISSAIIILVSSLFHTGRVNALTKGPRSPGLEFVFYSEPSVCYLALKAGQIDMMNYPLTPDQYDDITTHPGYNLLIAPYTDSYQMYGYNLNVNGTIATYPGVNSTMANDLFRKAIAYLVNKDYIVSNVFEYRAERIDVPYPSSQSNYWNTSVTYPNYPYEWDTAQAAIILDSAGFEDRDHNGIRNYPIGWLGRENGRDLDPLVFYADSTDPLRASMGRDLKGRLIAAGIPVDYHEVSPYGLWEPVQRDQDYHIYVGTQQSWRLPIWIIWTGIFAFQACSYAAMSVYSDYLALPTQMQDILGKMEECGINAFMDEVKRSSSWPNTIEDVKKFQGAYVNNVFEIPVCNLKTAYAYSTRIAGIVNENGYGPDNLYTFLNAYRADGPTTQPIRIGVPYTSQSLNIAYATWGTDFEVLDKIYAGLISCQPYDTVVDQPWVAQDWESGPWIDPLDPTHPKTYVDYWFRKDAWWVKPVTGETDGLFTAKDYEFTCHYIWSQSEYNATQHLGCLHRTRFRDIYNVTTYENDDFHARVYFNISSAWAYEWPTYPLLPKSKWLNESLAYHVQAEHFKAEDLNEYGYLDLVAPVVSGSEDTQIKVRLVNGTEKWLKWGRDYTWTMGNLFVKIDSIGGVKIDDLWVYYWITDDARGYTPANLPWASILEGCGTHYITSMTSYPPTGSGDTIMLAKNPNYFLETPILGELDWAWTWQGTTKPRSGYYKIETFDIVRVTGSYGTHGYGIPSPKWFPAADIASQDVGHIGINDLILVIGAYGKTFGTPP